MTPEQLAKIQREFLIKTEKQSAILIESELARVKREFSGFFGRNVTPATRRALESFLREFIALADAEMDIASYRFANIVERAQRQMINFAGKSLKKYSPRISSSIFDPDKEATQILIGRTQNGSQLSKFFQKLKEPLQKLARKNLIEGFRRGESSQAIAKRINDVADVGRYRALVISRNETVMAYRNASVNFYDEAGITEYRFLSVLDPRTCLICWRLHGTIWKLKTKPHIHTQCRCVICPVLKNDNQIKTGIELFGSLEKGVQKQILGEKRFQLFENGSYGLKDFTAIKKSKEFGNTHFVKPLDNLKQS